MPPKRSRPADRRRLADIQALRDAQLLTSISEDGTLVCPLAGPVDTPYAGHMWSVRIQLPTSYPYKSPSIGFVDPMFHPNVDLQSGTICLNVLNQEWTPVYNLVTIMRTLLPQLLTYPNPDDPLNEEAAVLWVQDREAYEVRCGVYVPGAGG